MDTHEQIVEVVKLLGKILIVFSDGKVATLDPSDIRPFAVDPRTITDDLSEDGDLDTSLPPGR